MNDMPILYHLEMFWIQWKRMDYHNGCNFQHWAR